ncbi:MAG: prephenate dehydrogenase [Anaerolineae bacterium]|jgi:prephenate dehydrogenase|nr:prephenate dehydrogenase [Anaerolineae bacterium]MBT7989826.1 prephenate dehydrogenase [Anaerolineae bacterium]
MNLQITIIGLGQIGTSIGLALEKYSKEILRVGHDKNMATAKNAQKLGAVDKVNRNLPSSVRDADIIILSLPFSEVRDTLGYIALDVKEDAVILDTAPAKAATHAWVNELLPAGRAYVGLAPVINPIYLQDEEFGINAAREDLFENGVTMIAAPPSTSETAMKVATTLVGLIGSQPLFADIAEVDGVGSTVQLLPQLTAAALLNATVDRPGWGEARKIAGRAYAETTRAILHQKGAASLGDAALANRENLSYKLDGMIASIQQLKESLDAEDKDALLEQLTQAAEGRENWLEERNSADWLFAGEGQTKPAEMMNMTAQLFGFRQRKPRE